jgi:hypothetical protein
MMSPSCAGGPHVVEERLARVDVDGIVVAEEDERRVLVVPAERAHEIERLVHLVARLERSQRGGLDRRAVGHGIGERHAELDQIGTGSRQAEQDLLRRGVVRIAGRDERHQRLATLLSERGEAAVDT